MENKDLIDCIPYYSFPSLKCVDIPKDGKSNRRERRRQELKRRKVKESTPTTAIIYVYVESMMDILFTKL